jgi:hypothetical protein
MCTKMVVKRELLEWVDITIRNHTSDVKNEKKAHTCVENLSIREAQEATPYRVALGWRSKSSKTMDSGVGINHDVNQKRMLQFTNQVARKDEVIVQKRERR